MASIPLEPILEPAPPLKRTPSVDIKEVIHGESEKRVKRGKENKFTTAFLPHKCGIDQSILDRQRKLQIDTYEIIFRFLQLLTVHELNVVTVESLTAGLMVSMLVDVPTFGGVVYGGYAVYDTDAKRQMVNVVTPNVYNHTTAREMAEGALLNTRALVAIAVSGQAGPSPQKEPEILGNVWIACSIRIGKNEFYTETKLFKACEYETTGLDISLVDICKNYRSEIVSENYRENRYVLPETHFVARNLIRLVTVRSAIIFSYDVIKKFFADPKGTIVVPTRRFTERTTLGPVLPNAAYDGLYAFCGDPSEIINNHLDKKIEVEWPEKASPGPKCPEFLSDLLTAENMKLLLEKYGVFFDEKNKKILEYIGKHADRKRFEDARSEAEVKVLAGGDRSSQEQIYYKKYLKYKNKLEKLKIKNSDTPI